MNILSRQFTILAIATVGIGLSAFSANDKYSDWNKEADRRKADYIYLEGVRQHHGGKNDAYYELIKRSFGLNDQDKYVGFEYGFHSMALLRGDSVEMQKGYNLIKDYAESAPEDFYSNAMFASIAADLGNEEEAVSVWERLHRNNPTRSEVTFNYANMLAKTGREQNIDKAIALYDTLEVVEGRSIPLSSQKIKLYMQKDDTMAVMNEARSLLASSPNTVEYNIFAGDMYSIFGDGDSALVFYDKAVELDPSSGVAYYSRANYYRSVGDSVAYDREVFQALGQDDMDLEPKLEILKDYVSALYSDTLQRTRITNMFQQLIEQHPHEAAIHNLYRDYLIAIQDYAGAAEQSSYALDVDPSDERQWLALSTLYLQIRDFERSLDAARRGLHYFPSNPDLYMLAATNLTQTDRYAEALDFLTKGIGLVKESDLKTLSEFNTGIGDTYYAAGDKDSAFVYYEKAIELEPLNLTALNNCAYYLACEDQNLDKAEEMILLVIGERPDDSTSLDTYAWVLFKKKDYAKAKEVIEKALENDDEPSSDLYDHAGDIMFMNQEPQQALDFWEKALKLDPDNELLQRKVKHKTYFYK